MTAGVTPQAHARPGWRRLGPSQMIALAMLAGVGLGVCFPDGAPGPGFRATDLQVLSSLFLRMISMTIVPLLFATLVVGIAGHGDDLKRMGRLAVRSLLYFEAVTTLALAVGLVAASPAPVPPVPPPRLTPAPGRTRFTTSRPTASARVLTTSK